ncbi:MAG: helix-turn-helix transcriptional regulator [Ruminococcus sp.]|nr:helix-turn-helix transcriptional regulator [Ruminococcus sp.]
MTTKQLAQATGISEAVINGLENDNGRDVGYSRIVDLATFFNVPTDLNVYLGNIEKAQDLARSMPAIPCSGRMMYSRSLKGKEATEEHQYLLLNMMWYACHEIRQICRDEDYTLEEKA